MGSELRAGLTSAHLVQLAFPALQDLPLLAPPPERSFTELIVAPEVALTKLPSTNGALAAKTDPAPVLSPSQVRCFFECPARWWFKYGLQLPERKNSSLALGLAVHQALEVNFREKLETREDLETTGVVIVFREAWMEQVPQTEFTSGESQGDLRRLGERLVAKYMERDDDMLERLRRGGGGFGGPGSWMRSGPERRRFIVSGPRRAGAALLAIFWG